MVTSSLSGSSFSPEPSLSSQIEHARRAALLVRATDLAVIVVTGGDRISWLNGLVTCNLANVTPGHAVYGLAVQLKGRIVCDVTVLVAEDRALVVVPASAREELTQAFDHYLVMEDVELAHLPFAIWQAHGPRARDLVAPARAASPAIAAAEIDFTGLGGAIVLAPESEEAAAWHALEPTLKSAGGLVGDDAGWEALRLEHAVPRFGKDFDATTYPQEATLERRAVSFDKGCYLGQEVVCMLEMRGRVKRKLAPLVLANHDPGDPPAKGTAVFDTTGKQVGEVTSSAPSPTLQTHIAFAMLKAASAAADTLVKVGSRDARVVDKPARAG
ncbi:YgfZ/GcvT domain-containing protein [Pendulispora albinea]|uniref:Folate-binding protein YgfZ n=1 Tax=Pendulispora albinea TaxID=2741071 RepID=A0ABZ2M6M6_9BACT